MSDTVDLTPADLAVLLGLAPEDGPALGAGAFRLDADFAAELRAMRGSIELTFAQIERLFGYKVSTLWHWRKTGLLACRMGGGGSAARGPVLRVAPAELVRRLRQIQAARNCFPAPAETPGQEQKRSREARERLAGRLNLKPQ